MLQAPNSFNEWDCPQTIRYAFTSGLCRFPINAGVPGSDNSTPAPTHGGFAAAAFGSRGLFAWEVRNFSKFPPYPIAIQPYGFISRLVHADPGLLYPNQTAPSKKSAISMISVDCIHLGCSRDVNALKEAALLLLL